MLNVKTFRVSTGHCLSQLGQQAGSNQLIADLFENPVHTQHTLASPRPSGAAAGAAVAAKAVAAVMSKPPPPAPPAKTLPHYKYFISVATQGVGGEHGWGIVGDNVERAVGNAATLLDSALTRLQTELTSKDKGVGGVTSGKAVKMAVDAVNA